MPRFQTKLLAYFIIGGRRRAGGDLLTPRKDAKMQIQLWPLTLSLLILRGLAPAATVLDIQTVTPTTGRFGQQTISPSDFTVVAPGEYGPGRIANVQGSVGAGTNGVDAYLFTLQTSGRLIFDVDTDGFPIKGDLFLALWRFSFNNNPQFAPSDFVWLLAWSDDNAGDPGSLENPLDPLIGEMFLDRGPDNAPYYYLLTISTAQWIPEPIVFQAGLVTPDLLTLSNGAAGGYSSLDYYNQNCGPSPQGSNFDTCFFGQYPGFTPSGYRLSITQLDDPVVEPEPATWVLMASGLLFFIRARHAAASRRKS